MRRGLLARLRRGSKPRPATAADAPAATSLPAGADPAVQGAPSVRERGRLRRRLRHLRAVRELQLADLGGLVYDLHRFGASAGEERDRQQALVDGKVADLQATDRELAALEAALGEERPLRELRIPGLSSCPRCEALVASDARFCSSCGMPTDRAPQPPAAAPAPEAGE